MVKSRPVVVLSWKHNQLCTVVPLSGTEPTTIETWHHQMNSLPESLKKKGTWRAKCDCVTTVSFERLDRLNLGRDANTGKRIYLWLERFW